MGDPRPDSSAAPQARAVLHLHPIYTTSVACPANPQILPVDQNSARYFNRVAVDTLYGGMADTVAEGRDWPGCWRISAVC